jgi:hypothetical protein
MVRRMISRVFSKAVDAIQDNKRPTTVPGFLRPIDTAAIARQLDLERRAAERGRQNLPASDAVTLDTVEREIVQKIESEWAWQGGEMVNNLRAYTQRLVGCSIDAEFSRLDVQAKDTLAQLREADHRAEAELGPLREHYIGTRDELNDFKRRHRLTRPARLPARRWTTVGLLTILVAFESVLNGFFFAKGSEFGLLGGVGIAIGISVTNVIFSFLFGLWPARWMFRRNLLVKLFGFVLTVAGLGAIIALHGFAAHFRDATAAVGEERALSTALSTLVTAPWRLADINSYYLFGLGLLFTLGAFYKGFTLDDPYPGYGVTSRRAVHAREAYSAEHADLFDELADIKDETVRRLDEGIIRMPSFPQQAANIRAQRAALVQTFRGYETSAEGAANELLERYRDANRRVRSTPAPAHFDHAWRLPYSFLESADARTLIAEYAEDTLDINTTLAELRRLSRELIDEYEMLMRNYPHATKLT